MNLVDSSGWLEYLSDGPQADSFASPLENVHNLLVPSICIFEIFKRVLSQRGEDKALQAVSLMHHGRVIPLDTVLFLRAARLEENIA